MIKSSINPVLTLDYMIHEDENKIFDRKSAQLKPSDIADEISAYANADGGTIVFGISDKTRRLEGINAVGRKKLIILLMLLWIAVTPHRNIKRNFLI